MPQMSPMNWLFLSAYIILIFKIININNFYCSIKLPTKNLKMINKFKNYTKTWKW